MSNDRQKQTRIVPASHIGPDYDWVTDVIADYTIGDSDTVLHVDTTGGAVELTLNNDPDNKARRIVIADAAGDTQANPITITCVDCTIDGESSALIASPYSALFIQSKGGDWITRTPPVRAVNSSNLRWDDVPVAVITGRIRGVSDPIPKKVADDGSGSDGVWGLAFRSGHDDEILLNWQLMHAYAIGTPIHYHAHLTQLTDGAGDIVLGMEFRAATYNPATKRFRWAANTTIIEKTFTLSGDHLDAQIMDFGELHDGTGLYVSSIFQTRFYVKATDSAHTFAGDIIMDFADSHINIDDQGSVSEWEK